MLKNLKTSGLCLVALVCGAVAAQYAKKDVATEAATQTAYRGTVEKPAAELLEPGTHYRSSEPLSEGALLLVSKHRQGLLVIRLGLSPDDVKKWIVTDGRAKGVSVLGISGEDGEFRVEGKLLYLCGQKWRVTDAQGVSQWKLEFQASQNYAAVDSAYWKAKGGKAHEEEARVLKELKSKPNSYRVKDVAYADGVWLARTSERVMLGFKENEFGFKRVSLDYPPLNSSFVSVEMLHPLGYTIDTWPETKKD